MNVNMWELDDCDNENGRRMKESMDEMGARFTVFWPCRPCRPCGPTGWWRCCSQKHNTQIPGPAIYTENLDSHLTQT